MPAPSSETLSSTAPPSARTATSTRVAPAWRAALASSSRASESSSSSRAPAASGVDGHVRLELAAAALLLDDGQQRGLQPAVLEHRRVQGAHDLAQPDDDRGQALLRGLDRGVVAAAAGHARTARCGRPAAPGARRRAAPRRCCAARGPRRRSPARPAGRGRRRSLRSRPRPARRSTASASTLAIALRKAASSSLKWSGRSDIAPRTPNGRVWPSITTTATLRAPPWRSSAEISISGSASRSATTTGSRRVSARSTTPPGSIADRGRPRGRRGAAPARGSAPARRQGGPRARRRRRRRSRVRPRRPRAGAACRARAPSSARWPSSATARWRCSARASSVMSWAKPCRPIGVPAASRTMSASRLIRRWRPSA